MKKVYLLTILLGLLVSSLGAPAEVLAQSDTGGDLLSQAFNSDNPPRRLVVTFKENADEIMLPQDSNYEIRNYGQRQHLIIPLEQSSEEYARSVLNYWQNMPGVESVVPDLPVIPFGVYPNDQYFPDYQKPPLYPTIYPNYWGMNMPAVWELTTGDPDLTIAIIDAGYYPHADMDGRVILGYDFYDDRDAPPELSDGEPGRDAHPYEVIPEKVQDLAPYVHGNQVTSIVGAIANNGIGIPGLNWNSRVMLIRGASAKGGNGLDLADAIMWAAGGQVPGVPTNPYPAKIINLSMGWDALYMDGQCPCKPFADALAFARQRGVVVVAPAGNYGGDTRLRSFWSCGVPIIAGGLTYHALLLGMVFQDYLPRPGLAGFTSYGDAVTIYAPAEDVPALAKSQAPGWAAGTSFASPIVAGIVSLMLSVNPYLSVNEIISILQKTALPLGNNKYCEEKQVCGKNIVINAYDSVRIAKEMRDAYSFQFLPLISK